MKFVDLNSARSSMFIALSHYRSGAVRRGRTNYMIDSGAHSALPNGASGGSDVAINMSPSGVKSIAQRLQQIAAFATEGHERKLCQKNKNLRTCYAEHAEGARRLPFV